MNNNTALQKVCDTLKIRCEATYGGEVPEGWASGTNPYKIKLMFGRRVLRTSFYTGSAHTSEPTAADVLSCICSDANVGEQSFEEFCNEFGYDADSRKAEKTWKSCVAMAPKLRKFLGEHFEEVANAEHCGASRGINVTHMAANDTKPRRQNGDGQWRACQRLAAASGVDPRVVKRFLTGGRLHFASRLAIQRGVGVLEREQTVLVNADPQLSMVLASCRIALAGAES